MPECIETKRWADSRRLEALHLAFSSAEGLVGDLGPVVLASLLFVVSAQTNLLEHSPVRAQLVGRESIRNRGALGSLGRQRQVG